MRKKKCKFRYDKENLPLRIYFSSEAVKTLYISALIACILVTATLHLFYIGILPIAVVCIVASIELVSALSFGGHWMMSKAKRIVEPMEEINEAMNKVTEGDLGIQIVRDGAGIKEINSMISNFNTMTHALQSMEYMNKDFISNVSHEVKTPVAAISGLTEILQDGLLSETEQKEYLALVHEEAVRLSRLCENMLHISKLDNQTMITKQETINVTEQIRRCVILLCEKWELKELSFEMNLDDIMLTTDPDLLLQVWMNLLDNAMKYSKKQTTIHISGWKENGVAQIKIRDEGLGIPKEKLAHIFERFYQCEESHQKQGAGLGLSIVERILEILKGSIECKSQVGVGTEMIVTIKDNKNRE